MIPTTYAVTLLLMIVSMLCWGSWANTMKMAGKWRFELYYFDYVIGVMLCATLAAFTFGSVETVLPEADRVQFPFLDNLAVTGKRQIGLAMAGGAVFNLANLLLVAAISVAGLSVAFPVGIGLALVEGAILNYVIHPAGHPAMVFGGVALVLLAIVMTSLAYAALARQRAREAPPQPVADAPQRGRRPAPRRSSPWKGIGLSLAAGVLMGLFYPLVEMSKEGDLGLGPYAAAFCFALGVLVTTPVFNLFFMNLPVEGDPVGFRDYLAGTGRQHALGVLGGVIWGVGTISNFVAASAPRSVNVGPAISYAIGQGATLVSTLWGLVVWKEFAGAEAGVRVRIWIMLLLYAAGLALLSLAPLYR
ncbi:MAG: AcrB/AcrD/AcrF family protein [Bryobacteraceae bacterium]